MTDLYASGRYAAANPTWHAEDAAHKAASVRAMLDHLQWRPTHIIDVGCGTGDVLRHLLNEHAAQTAEGWDLAPYPLAAGPAQPRLQLHQGDPITAGRRADLCLCLDVVEHVPDDLGMLRSLSHLAQRQIVRLPLDLSALDVVRPHRMIRARRELGHLHAYSRASALALVEDAGLQLVAQRLDRVPPTLSGLRAHTIDGLRRALRTLAPRAAVDLLGGWSLLLATENKIARCAKTETSERNPA